MCPYFGHATAWCNTTSSSFKSCWQLSMILGCKAKRFTLAKGDGNSRFASAPQSCGAMESFMYLSSSTCAAVGSNTLCTSKYPCVLHWRICLIVSMVGRRVVAGENGIKKKVRHKGWGHVSYASNIIMSQHSPLRSRIAGEKLYHTHIPDARCDPSTESHLPLNDARWRLLILDVYWPIFEHLSIDH